MVGNRHGIDQVGDVASEERELKKPELAVVLTAVNFQDLCGECPAY